METQSKPKLKKKNPKSLTQKSELKEVWCRIIDAVYKEDLGPTEDPTFSNSVFLQLQELETKTIFTSQLSAEEVQDLTGLSRPISSKELIDFADILRQREAPIRMLVPVNANIVDADIIKKTEELERIEEPVELGDSVVEKKVSKFSIKNKKENINNE
jgi:hypothetical protein